MQLQVTAEQMVILFVVVIAGYVCGRTRLMTPAVSKGLSALIVSLTCPCLVLSSTMGERMPDRSLILPLLAVGTLTYVILLTLAAWLPRLLRWPADERGLYSFMFAFGNVGFIGYPVVASMFGPEAVFYASVLNVPNTVSVFIWGAQFVAGHSEGETMVSRLYSPAMVGTYLSILIVAIGWRVPHVVAQPISMIGAITVPASLLIIGSSIAQIPPRHMAGGPRHVVMAAFRLLLLPLGVGAVMHALVWAWPAAAVVFHPQIVSINTMLIAMPVASFGTIFCLKYGIDETIMAQGTLLTTLLSLVTIPIVASLI